MRILIVSKYFYPYKGGIETVVLETAKNLAKKGHNITILASSHKNELKKTEMFGKIKIIRSKTWFNFSAAPINPGMFFTILNEKFDVCILHEPNPFNNRLAVHALMLKGKPWVVTYHSDIIGRNGIITKPLFWFYKNICQKIFILGMAKKIMPTSPQYVEISDTLKDYSRKKIEVVPNGVDLSKINKIDKKRKNNQIFFLGRLIYYKGIDYLIKAMKQALKSVPDAELIIAGEGELEEYLKQISKEEKVDKHIKFVGKINEKQVEKYFNESTVFVLPSIHKSEAFGIVILEALAHGCPVITTDISGTVYAAGKNSVIVKNKNEKELADAIVSVLKDKQLQETMSKQGLKHVKEFDWKNTTDKLEKVLKDAVKN